MKWTVSHPTFIGLFGASLETVYRGKHLVLCWDDSRQQFFVIQSMTRREVARATTKGECYRQLKAM